MSSSLRKDAEKEKTKDKAKTPRTAAATTEMDAVKPRGTSSSTAKEANKGKEKRPKKSSSVSRPKSDEKAAAKPSTTMEVGNLVSNAPVLGRVSSGKSKASGGDTPVLLSSPDMNGRLHDVGGGNHANNPPALTGYSRPRVTESHSTSGAASKQASSQRPSSHQHRDPDAHAVSGFLDSPSRDVDNRNTERDEDLDDDGIVASSRLALARMSFENCVKAAAHLQDLMMAHAAAVTSTRQRQADGATGLPPIVPRTQVNHVTLSMRPLDEIADDLSNQLWQLCEAYQSSSRAERQLMGVVGGLPAPGPGLSPAQMRAVAAGGAGGDAPTIPNVANIQPLTHNAAGATRGTVREMGIAPGDTFGPMTSTQLVTTDDDLDFANGPMRGDGGANVIAVAGANYPLAGDDGDGMIDVGQANPGPRLAAQNTQFVYPDGTRVSFPISTFGELVTTELMNSAAVDDWASAVVRPAVDTRGGKPRSGANHGSGEFNVADTRKGKTSSGTAAAAKTPKTATKAPADETHLNGMDTELLHGYLRALEAKLTDKQRLDALREARGGSKAREGRASVSSLSHLAQSKSLPGTKSGSTKQ